MEIGFFESLGENFNLPASRRLRSASRGGPALYRFRHYLLERCFLSFFNPHYLVACRFELVAYTHKPLLKYLWFNHPSATAVHRNAVRVGFVNAN